jgi:hypothetical protein
MGDKLNFISLPKTDGKELDNFILPFTFIKNYCILQAS